MTFRRSISVLAALLAVAVTSPRPVAQTSGQCGYIWVGGGGLGTYVNGWTAMTLYTGFCGDEYGVEAGIAVRVYTPSGYYDENADAGSAWSFDGFVDVDVPLQPGETGLATTQGWGGISYLGTPIDWFYDELNYWVQGAGGGGGSGEDPPPDEDPPPPPPSNVTITFSPSDYVTRDYNSDDVFITAVVSPAGQGWEQYLYWVGDGESTGNELERRFSTSEVRTMAATAVIAPEAEATATVKIVPVVDVSPSTATVPVHPSEYVTVFAQVSPPGEATAQWSGDGWSYPESPHIRYFSRDTVGTFNAVAQAGESQPKPTQVNVVQAPAQLKLFLDVEPYNFSVANPQSEDGIYVPGAKEDGSSVPVSEIQTGQQLRLYAAFVNQANQIVAPPANASVTFELSGNSHWAGYAMNQGSGTDEDFAFQGNFQNVAFSGNVAQVILLCKDYGGSVRVDASSNGTPAPQLRLPRDANSNWLPDSGWKATTGTGVESVPENQQAVDDPWSDADNDIGAVGSPVPPADVPLNHGWYGDGLIRFHEYRGFIVRGNHVRTDPRRLDVFMSHNVRDLNNDRILDAVAFSKASLNQFRITAHELLDESEGGTSEYATGPGGQVNANADAGQAIAGYLPSTTYQRALRIVNGVAPGDKWGNTTGSCGPPGQPAQSGLIPLSVSSMVVDVGKLFNDGNQMPAFTTLKILNEVRKVVAHEIGHGIHISHRPQNSGQQCADSANLGGTVSVMNDDQQLNGEDASFPGSRYNNFDIRQIRLHLRQNAQ